MTESDFKRLISKDNLELAWRRVTTGRNFSYKRFSRPSFHLYELASEENLSDLHERLEGNSYQPKAPHVVFVPKKSGLQRGISLLRVEDQIVYQAVANILAEKVRTQRLQFAGTHVFSNQLNPDPASIFFLEDWRIGYRGYLQEIDRLHAKGFKWVAQFDLAAFYDTISHELLFRSASRSIPQSPKWPVIRSWFQTWASSRAAWPLHHGIPQGPLTSDFLAEVFLLPVDKAMAKGHKYVRYVDDIRLFGKSELEVLKAVRRLEAICRERGLIPQGQKFEILHTQTVKEAMGSLPSIGDPDSDNAEKILGMSRGRAEQVFTASLSRTRPRRIQEKTKARYALFRGPPSPKIRRLVLDLLPKHPDHIDAFLFYLRNFRRSKRVIGTCTACAKSTPFDYVAGELLQFLSERVNKPEARRLLDVATSLAGSRHAGVSAKWGALVFLCKCEELGMGRYSNYAFFQPGLVQALATKSLPASTLTSSRFAEVAHGGSVEASMAVVSRLVSENIPLAQAGITPSRCPTQVQHVLAALGVSPRVGVQADPVSETIARRYGCPRELVWRKLFGTEYGHALEQLVRAEALFDMGRSEWLNYQDSFNNALFLALQIQLNRLTLPGACRTKGANGHLVKYGSMLAVPHPFAVAHPNIGAALDLCHRRRNKLPSSHPYDEKTQTRSKPLAKREQTDITRRLAVAYCEVIQICIANSILN